MPLIAIDVVVALLAVFVFGYFLGKSGKNAVEKAKQEMEDAAIAHGHGEVTVENGRRVFRWKTNK